MVKAAAGAFLYFLKWHRVVCYTAVSQSLSQRTLATGNIKFRLQHPPVSSKFQSQLRYVLELASTPISYTHARDKLKWNCFNCVMTTISSAPNMILGN